jgi:Zn-dependent protease
MASATTPSVRGRRSENGRGGWVVGRIGGIPLRIDASWILIFFLVAWSAASWFPRAVSVEPLTAAALAVIAAILLFASIVLHELAHALTARSLGYEVDGITLFVFGGVSEIEGEPTSGRDELLIAGVGPATSLAISGVLWVAVRALGGLSPLSALCHYLSVANLALAVFNVLPGFPLDGGRLLRASLRLAGRSMIEATRGAAAVGRAMGLGLVLLGVSAFVVGLGLSGIWLALIGWFLARSAEASLEQTLFRARLELLTAADVASRVAPLDPDESIGEALASHGLLGGVPDRYPVARGGRLLGTVDTRALLRIPRERWPLERVGSFVGRDDGGVARAAARLTDVLDDMTRLRRPTVAVEADDGSYVGVVRLEDVAQLARNTGG